MKIFPAIDLKNGKCVRLTKGDFKSEKIYNIDPINQAETFSNMGFKYLHIIDLDGALKGSLINLRIIEKIVKKFNFNIQVGGGIRTEDNIAKLLDIGADKIILGTAAIKDKLFLKSCCKKYSGSIALSLDVRKNNIATSGWKDQTSINIYVTEMHWDGAKFGLVHPPESPKIECIPAKNLVGFREANESEAKLVYALLQRWPEF